MHLNGENCHLKSYLKDKSCRKSAEGLNINDSEKELETRGSSVPTPGHYACTR